MSNGRTSATLGSVNLRLSGEDEIQIRVDPVGPSTLEPILLIATREEIGRLAHSLQVFCRFYDIPIPAIRPVQDGPPSFSVVQSDPEA